MRPRSRELMKARRGLALSLAELDHTIAAGEDLAQYRPHFEAEALQAARWLLSLVLTDTDRGELAGQIARRGSALARHAERERAIRTGDRATVERLAVERIDRCQGRAITRADPVPAWSVVSRPAPAAELIAEAEELAALTVAGPFAAEHDPARAAALEDVPRREAPAGPRLDRAECPVCLGSAPLRRSMGNQGRPFREHRHHGAELGDWPGILRTFGHYRDQTVGPICPGSGHSAEQLGRARAQAEGEDARRTVEDAAFASAIDGVTWRRSGVFAIVGCSQSKREGRARPARDLYTGSLFRLAVAELEARSEQATAGAGEPVRRWWIASAEHGGCGPADVIAPYDRSLADMSAKGRERWARRAVNDLGEHTPWTGARVELHAMGAGYAEPLRRELELRGATVEIIGEGLAYGHRRQGYALRSVSFGLTVAEDHGRICSHPQGCELRDGHDGRHRIGIRLS